MTDELEIRMAQVLAHMSVLSEASGVRLGDKIHGGEQSNAPKGPRLSLGDWHREAWRRARTHEKRFEAVVAAEKALINAKIAPKRTETPGTLDWRLEIANDPRPALVVAEIYGVTERHVYRCRKDTASVRRLQARRAV